MPNYGDLALKAIPANYLNAVSASPMYYNRAAVMVARRLCNDLFWGGETDLSAVHAATMLSMLPLEVLNSVADNSKCGLTWKILSWARMASTHDTMLPELDYNVAKKYGMACGIRLVHIATNGCLGLYSREEHERKRAEGLAITTIFPRVLQDYGMNREESTSFVRNFARTFNGSRTYENTFAYINEAQTHRVVTPSRVTTLMEDTPVWEIRSDIPLGSTSSTIRVEPSVVTGRVHRTNVGTIPEIPPNAEYLANSASYIWQDDTGALRTVDQYGNMSITFPPNNSSELRNDFE